MSKIADKIRDVGLFRVAAELEDLARNAIQLVVTSDLPTTIGTSRLGGLPDLPDEIEWPTWNDVPLAFIAQINLAEAEPFDLEGCLPKSGMLYFFYEAARQTWGYDPKDSGSSNFWSNRQVPCHKRRHNACTDSSRLYRSNNSPFSTRACDLLLGGTSRADGGNFGRMTFRGCQPPVNIGSPTCQLEVFIRSRTLPTNRPRC